MQFDDSDNEQEQDNNVASLLRMNFKFRRAHVIKYVIIRVVQTHTAL